MDPKVKTSAGMETASETVARISAAMANPTPSVPTPAAPTTASNPLVEMLTQRLTQQSQGISSSSTTNLQNSINEAIAATKTAGAATAERLQSERMREVGFAKDRASATISTAMEGQTGYATQVAGLRELTATTEKSIRDLDARYQEALLANDANTAKSVSDLMIKKLEFQNEQEQNFFSNMMNLVNYQQNEQQFNARLSQEERQFQEKMGFDITMFEKQTARDERNQVMQLASEYGVPVSDSDTIETMIGKISPFVSEERALRLQEIGSSIKANNARAMASMQEYKNSQGGIDDFTANAMAMAYLNGNTDIMGGLKTVADQGKVYAKYLELAKEKTTILQDLASTATSYEDFVSKVQSDDSGYSVTQAQMDAYKEMYANTWNDNYRAQKKSNKKNKQMETNVYNPRTGTVGPIGFYMPDINNNIY